MMNRTRYRLASVFLMAAAGKPVPGGESPSASALNPRLNKGRKGALIAVAVVVILLVAGVSAYIVLVNHKKTSLSITPSSSFSIVTQGTAVTFYLGAKVSGVKITSTVWNFGNGISEKFTGGSGSTVQYIYPYPGNYLVYVRVNGTSGTSADNAASLLPVVVSPLTSASDISQLYPASIAVSASSASNTSVSSGEPSIIGVGGFVNVTSLLPASFGNYPTASGWNLQGISFSSAGHSFSWNSSDVSIGTDYLNVTYKTAGITYVLMNATTNSSTSSLTWSYIQTVAVGKFAIPPLATSSRKGIVDAAYIPGGFRTMDPALAYDTISGEVVFEIYQNLVQFAPGNNPASFIPVLAAQVPSVSNGLLSIQNRSGLSYVNYTFNIRQNIKFSDGNPLTVYDVWFSFMRTLLFTNDPGDPGWLLAHALIPGASVYGPYNLTPFWIDKAITYNSTSIEFHLLPTTNGSLYGISPVNGTNAAYFLTGVNTSSSTAFSEGYAATTYTSYGASVYFLQLLTGTEASIMDASWAAQHGAGIPGNTTQDYYNYQAFGNPPQWNQAIQFGAMGTGPYMVSLVNPGQLIQFVPNPYYTSTPGYPPASQIPPSVTIYYYSSESVAQLQFINGAADFAEGAFPSTSTGTVVNLIQKGLVKSISEPQVATNFYNYNLQINVTGLTAAGYTASFPASSEYSVPGIGTVSVFFGNLSVRKAFTYAYNQAQLISEYTSYGISFAENLTGFIPRGVSEYPSNITNVSADPYVPYYNMTLAEHYWNNTPYRTQGKGNVTFPIFDLSGQSVEDQIIESYWIPAIEQATNGTVKPYLEDLPSSSLFTYESVASGTDILPIAWDAWYADYPDASDYAATFASPFALDMYPFGVYPGTGFNSSTNPHQWSILHSVWNYSYLALNELNASVRDYYYWMADLEFSSLYLMVGNIQPLGVLYYRSWIVTSSLAWSLSPGDTLENVVFFGLQKT
ncbi:MAG: PKD domain-containing protein [Thermoplasmata archaeon]|nr:PKD domain-containing protein [Candidatus Sysuiplasma jiujiangense]